jgi:YHS domain-containing protein
MQVSGVSELKAEFNGNIYYFCSSHCRKSFLANPQEYVKDQKEMGSANKSVNEIVAPKNQPPLKTYFPLLLILAYLLGIVAVAEFASGSLNEIRMMNHFMGGFFLFFSFFKFLDLRGFADVYRTYDIVAKGYPFYGWLYPFIELALGMAYISQISIKATHSVTLAVMLISSVGVIQSLLRKNQIQCACLGTVFNLPMSKVTLIEDLLMAAMAAVGIFFQR